MDDICFRILNRRIFVCRKLFVIVFGIGIRGFVVRGRVGVRFCGFVWFNVIGVRVSAIFFYFI